MNKPLQSLTIVQKARILHVLFRSEIPEFLSYLNELTETVLNGAAHPPEVWKEQCTNIDLWFEMAENIQEKMARHQKVLYPDSKVFADKLFDEHSAKFCVYALNQYVALKKYSEPKFKPAIELLFG